MSVTAGIHGQASTTVLAAGKSLRRASNLVARGRGKGKEYDNLRVGWPCGAVDVLHITLTELAASTTRPGATSYFARSLDLAPLELLRHIVRARPAFSLQQ